MPKGRPRKLDKTTKTASSPAADNHLTLERDLFAAVDKLRKNLEHSDYKHVVLGLIFLRQISLAFEARHEELVAAGQNAEAPNEYTSETIFWVPKLARWSHLKANATHPTIGKLIDNAMAAIETENPPLKGVLPKDYNRPALDKLMLGELINLISGIALGMEDAKARDLLGRVYEYFLGGFAGSEGKRGGEFYTPRSVVRVMVEMLEPFPDIRRGIEGRVYDPCCGSGGMFVQAEQFLKAHGRPNSKLALYGQESNYTTWRLAKMNLAARGIDASAITWNNESSFHKDEWPDETFDFIFANPPFNVSDWGGERLRVDPRWRYGAPPVNNANYAWLQHVIYHLAPNGTAGVVLANGSMSSAQSGEDTIRRAMVEDDVIDCMIALPSQLFYSTQIAVCLWFLSRNKKDGHFRDRRGETLFIDARKLGHMAERTRRELADDDINKIARTYHAWRGETEAGAYEDLPGFCKTATQTEIKDHNYGLTPSRYVGTAATEDNNVKFAEQFAALNTKLEEQFAKADALNNTIRKHLSAVVL